MWRWLNGLVNFRDTEFFYPFNTALGYSDVFLVQGITYSVFRFAGVDSLSSWLNVTILLVVIGNLGWILVAKKFLKHFIIQILFVLTMVSSLSFVHYFTFNPNVVGYSFLSWILIFLLNTLNERNPRKYHIKVNIFILVFLIYALSCWYAAFFLAVTMIIRSVVLIVTKQFQFNFKSILPFYRIYLYFSPLTLFLTWLFYFIYISVSDQPGRPISEMIDNSPRIQQILSGANVNGEGIKGSIFSEIYTWLNLDKPITFNGFLGDWGGGLGLFLPLMTIAAILSSLFFTRIIKDYSWVISVTLTYAYLMVFGNNLSLHSYFFNIVPGLNSIRSPSRYVIFVGFAAIFLLFYYFDKAVSNSKNYLVNFTIVILLVTVFMDQQRSPFKGWDRQNFINTDLHSLKSDIQSKCDYFYYDRPGGWWFDQIEALSFAVQIGVPTVNGYSGAFPPGYPGRPWNDDLPNLEIFNWMKQIDQDKRGCLILGNSNIRYLSEPVSSIDFYGFTDEENNGESSWRWAVSQKAHLLIIGEINTKQQIEFELKGAPCFDSRNLKISMGDNIDIKNIILEKKAVKISLKLDFNRERAKSILFDTDSPVCNLEDDPRDLYFEIKNVTLSKL
jgi:hypothetical protein